MLETAIAPVPNADEITDDGVWIEALPARVYHTPQYGEVPIPVDKLQRMITNFKANVRGQEIATDFEHGMDPAKGKQASGWYKDFDIRPSSDDETQSSLWAKVELTEEAKQDVQARKWKYWSVEWDDEYETDDGHIVQDVILGGGLTNRPVAKRTMPINFSEEMWNELDDDTRKQFAVWTTAYVNSLPDSAFLYIDSNGRHLPYRDKSGKIDLPHLRAAASRANQVSGIPAATVTRIRAKIQRLLGGSKKASELAAKYDGDREVYYDTLMTGIELSENAAWAHSDPGIVAPLYGATEQPDPGFGLQVPRVTGNPADDKAIGEGWRREPLPAGDPALADELTKPELREPSGKDKHFGENNGASEGGKTVEFTEENVTELRQLLDIPADSDSDAFMSVARNAFSELKTFKDSIGQTQQEKQFSEQFPAVWAEHVQLLESNRVGSARAFAESVQRLTTPKGEGDNITFEPTRNGLSALALETIADVHKKFSEGTATMEDFEGVIKAITNGGVVEFGEVGSSAEKDLPAIDTATAQGIAGTRRVFADKVAEVQKQYSDKNEGKEMEFSEAVAKASEMYPDLAAAYRATAA